MTKGGLCAPGPRHTSRRKVYGAAGGGFLGLSDKQWVGIGIGAGVSALALGASYRMQKKTDRFNQTVQRFERQRDPVTGARQKIEWGKSPPTSMDGPYQVGSGHAQGWTRAGGVWKQPAGTARVAPTTQTARYPGDMGVMPANWNPQQRWDHLKVLGAKMEDRGIFRA